MSKQLFISIDTTGLPKWNTKNYKKLDFFDNARLIGCTIGTLTDSETYLIKPDNFTIDDNSVAVSIHGLTNNYINEKGICIKDFIKILEDKINDSDYLVTHNMEFVLNIIFSELYRYKNKLLITKIKNINKKCIMKTKTNKYLTLEDLYSICYPDKEFTKGGSKTNMKYIKESFKHLNKSTVVRENQYMLGVA